MAGFNDHNYLSFQSQRVSICSHRPLPLRRRRDTICLPIQLSLVHVLRALPFAPDRSLSLVRPFVFFLLVAGFNDHNCASSQSRARLILAIYARQFAVIDRIRQTPLPRPVTTFLPTRIRDRPRTFEPVAISHSACFLLPSSTCLHQHLLRRGHPLLVLVRPSITSTTLNLHCITTVAKLVPQRPQHICPPRICVLSRSPQACDSSFGAPLSTRAECLVSPRSTLLSTAL